MVSSLASSSAIVLREFSIPLLWFAHTFGMTVRLRAPAIVKGVGIATDVINEPNPLGFYISLRTLESSLSLS